MISPAKVSTRLFIGLFIILLMISESVYAERYRGSVDSSAPVKKAIQQLNVYKDKFEGLLVMQDRIESWKKELDKEHDRIGQEMQMLEADKQKLKQGEVSEEAVRNKWTITGRKEKIEKDVEIFEADANNFNQYIRSYNELAMELVEPLKQRGPQDVQKLVISMGDLIRKLEDALVLGNINGAKDILKKSSLAQEFVGE
jgi:hypothetical protein